MHLVGGPAGLPPVEHALLGERAGVLDGLLADRAEALIDGRIVAVGCSHNDTRQIRAGHISDGRRRGGHLTTKGIGVGVALVTQG